MFIFLITVVTAPGTASPFLEVVVRKGCAQRLQPCCGTGTSAACTQIILLKDYARQSSAWLRSRGCRVHCSCCRSAHQRMDARQSSAALCRAVLGYAAEDGHPGLLAALLRTATQKVHFRRTASKQYFTKSTSRQAVIKK